MQDNFYVKDFRHYQLLGWQHYLGTTAFLVLKELWAMEQTTNYHINKNAFLQSREFSVSDKQLMELLGIGSKNTIKDAILKLEKYKLIKIISDRNKNHIGFATEYLITKPIPIPENIRVPKTLNALNGEVRCKQIIDELISLNHMVAESDTSTEDNIEHGSEKDETSSSQNLPPNKEPRPKTKTSSKGDVFYMNKDPKIRTIVESLSKVKEFQRFDIKSDVHKLHKDYSIDVLEKVAYYYEQKGQNTHVRNLYSYLKKACENIDDYLLNNDNLEKLGDVDTEFFKNSKVDEIIELEYEHDAEAFNFSD